MVELSLNILDITYNSIRAGAKNIEITVNADYVGNKLTIIIADDGCGMEEKMLKTVTDPFTTTRTTRKVGMGVPLFKMYAEMCGGTFNISSKPSVGTTVTAEMQIGHIDRPPIGNLGLTMTTLIGAAPATEFRLVFIVDGKKYVFDTKQVKETLDGVDIESVEILSFLEEMINENIENIIGGKIL